MHAFTYVAFCWVWIWVWARGNFVLDLVLFTKFLSLLIAESLKPLGLCKLDPSRVNSINKDLLNIAIYFGRSADQDLPEWTPRSMKSIWSLSRSTTVFVNELQDKSEKKSISFNTMANTWIPLTCDTISRIITQMGIKLIMVLNILTSCLLRERIERKLHI